MTKKSYELKPYRFMESTGLGFKVVVLARNLQIARAYVKSQASFSLAWRRLFYVREGHPPEETRKDWLVSVIKNK